LRKAAAALLVVAVLIVVVVAAASLPPAAPTMSEEEAAYVAAMDGVAEEARQSLAATGEAMLAYGEGTTTKAGALAALVAGRDVMVALWSEALGTDPPCEPYKPSHRDLVTALWNFMVAMNWTLLGVEDDVADYIQLGADFINAGGNLLKDFDRARQALAATAPNC
jgi:hypothetical protein